MAQPQGRTVQCPQQPLSVLWGHRDTAAESRGDAAAGTAIVKLQTASGVVAIYSLPTTAYFVLNDAPSFISYD